MGVTKALALAVGLALAAGPAAAQTPVERAKTLELDSPYIPPPGDALEHHASGYAKARTGRAPSSGSPSSIAGPRPCTSRSRTASGAPPGTWVIRGA